MSILVTMNSSLVNIIQNFMASGRVIFTETDYNAWNSVGTRTTRDTVNTLAQLYQRKLQAAPIQTSRFHDLDDVEFVRDYEDSNGNTYTGEMKNGMKHGEGVLIYANGDRYEGEFKDDLFHGYGRVEWVDIGDKYEGHWAEGKKWKKGKLTLWDGCVYDGYWEDNRNGWGTVTKPNGWETERRWSLNLDENGYYYEN